jgi:hypothetical protein
MTNAQFETHALQQLEHIRGLVQRDPTDPAATELEEGLRIDFIEFIHNKGKKSAMLCYLAHLVLSTRDIEFTREWEKPALTHPDPEVRASIKEAMEGSTLPEREKRRILYRILVGNRAKGDK